MFSKLLGLGNNFLWNFLLLFLLCGTGIYYSFRLRFIQLRRLREGFRHVFGNISLNGKKHDKGQMSPFQSIATAIAAQVGTGNLAGAATAIVSGGPGAIFWMWVSAFFGMATIYGEAVLAQETRVEAEGEVTGGPVYYIKRAFPGKSGRVLAALFSVFIILALGFMGNMVQSNSVGAAFNTFFKTVGISVPGVAIGVFVAAIAGFVFFGGTDRLASVLEKIVPVMALIYIAGAFILVLLNIRSLPNALYQIFAGAFSPRSVLGAGAGISVREAIRYGVARGLFSNEAGMGSTPHAHARAKARTPHEQGLCAMVSVFIDTFIILNLTVFAILTTGAVESGEKSIALTQTAFVRGFGSFGYLFVAVCLFFFAFSTILGWHFFGAVNVKYLFGSNALPLYSLITLLCIVIGASLRVDLVWDMADFFNGLMVIPNVLALVKLVSLVKKAEHSSSSISSD